MDLHLSTVSLIKPVSSFRQPVAPVDCDIRIFEPSAKIRERMKAERTKLNPARAMLLDVACDLSANGEFFSEFAAEKIVYFLQRFGAADIFKLQYKPYIYGPYSGKVRYVLHHLNGSYISGMSDLNNRLSMIFPDFGDASPCSRVRLLV